MKDLWLNHLGAILFYLFLKHEEHIDNIDIGNFAAIYGVAEALIGEWKVYHFVTATRNGQRVEECFMNPATVSEI